MHILYLAIRNFTCSFVSSFSVPKAFCFYVQLIDLSSNINGLLLLDNFALLLVSFLGQDLLTQVTSGHCEALSIAGSSKVKLSCSGGGAWKTGIIFQLLLTKCSCFPGKWHILKIHNLLLELLISFILLRNLCIFPNPIQNFFLKCRLKKPQVLLEAKYNFSR